MNLDHTEGVIPSEALLHTFLDMVRIDSPSGEEDQMRAYLVQRLDAYGLAPQTDSAGNLIVDIPGNQCDHSKVLVLSGHMDVVPPCKGIQPIIKELENGDCLIQSDNTTVLGADDKSGLAPILEAVFTTITHDLPRPPLRLIFTICEETSLGGAKALSDDVLQADFAITLDHTGSQGTIIHQAPTYVGFEIRCHGKSVHAGIMPEQGINAIVFASRVIEQLHLGRLDEETTSNIGFFNGGKATNIVPDEAVIRGEIRSHSKETIHRELAHIDKVLEMVSQHMPGTSYEWSHHFEFEGYQVDDDHSGLIRVQEAARQSGLEPKLVRTNGGSDNNVFMTRGLTGVVLSAGYVNPHALTESVLLSDMMNCAKFLLNIIAAFAK